MNGFSGNSNIGATVLIAVLLSGATVYLLQAIISPLLLAVFLLVMVADMAGALNRLVPKVPLGLVTGLSVVIIAAAFVMLTLFLIDNLTGLIADSGDFNKRLNAVLRAAGDMFGVRQTPSFGSLMQSVQTPEVAGAVVAWLQSGLSAAGFVLIYLGFLLVSQRSFAAKLNILKPTGEGAVDVDQVLGRIQKAVTGYVSVQTTTGLMIAAASWAVMAWLGLPQPIFWAFLIFVASYVPIVGGVVAIFVPALFSVMVFEGFGKPLILLSALLVIGFVVGNIIQPRMQGVGLNLDPVVVLLSLAFWGVLLGATGAFLSTPLTVAAMAILAEFKSTRWLAVLLSNDGNPYPTRPRKFTRRTRAPV
ncbi:AI-2E family transporter [Hyphomonas sp.]|uniref:AI-2E family transporter n=1 Tax=Hyphomonas sp. TaxID=87 RepID=UPI00333E9592